MKWKQDLDGWTLIKAVPNSGAFTSVTPEDTAPGYTVRETQASREGKNFGSASGHTVKNICELAVPMQSSEGVWTRQPWQVAPTTRPLLSVGEECDRNNIVIFGRQGGAILNLESGATRRFTRVNGMYEIDMWVPPIDLARQELHKAAGFTRQG